MLKNRNEVSVSWQQSLAHVVKDWGELLALLQLEAEQVDLSAAAMAQFPLRVPHAFVQRMRQGDPQDPLLRQILPIAEEMQTVEGFSPHPLQEMTTNPVPGLLHKYHGRVLLTLAGSCPINCRYCFRRHFPYKEQVTGVAGWQPMLDYIRAHTAIREVILSGGEPLLVKDDLLASLMLALEAIPHVSIVRIHTRFPIVIPDRVTDQLVHILSSSRLQPVVVVHCNHAQEIDEAVRASLQKLSRGGIMVLNQSVLLKGVNDRADTLADLSYQLFKAGCLPYYLHLLDTVSGAAHFRVTDTQAKKIQKALITKLPGYLMPKFVREIPGELSKSPF